MSELMEQIAEPCTSAQKIIISNKKDKSCEYRRVEIVPMELKGQKVFQVAKFTEKQSFFKNLSVEEMLSDIESLFPETFCQMNVFTADSEYEFKVSKKGKLFKRVVPKRDLVPAFLAAQGNDRKKNYIIEEGTVIPPLVDMGVFTQDGRVVRSMYDKFKQINRFVEIVDDVLKDEKKEVVHMIDFGCGKSYLTFIVYYYITEVLGKKAVITGLDLKKDVIAKCNEAAKKYGYDNLHFELGDINGYKTDMEVDLVMTLHACDIATDFALFNAVSWNAKYILSVPCCQHEVNAQIASEEQESLMRYGIIKERIAALATDAIRADMLTYCGYKTQVMEFVDFAHSPKNLLIRAVKSNISKEKREKTLAQVKCTCESLSIQPTIVKLLREYK